MEDPQKAHIPQQSAVVAADDGRPTTTPRGALWLQIPRRALLLIAACTIALFLIRLWPLPGGAAQARGAVISPLVMERLPGTLLLLSMALVIALALSLVLATGGALVAWLALRAPRAASLMRALGRLAFYSWMPLPIVVSAFLLLVLLLSAGGAVPFAIVGDNPSTLFLGAFLLALYPALLAAEDAVRLGAAGVHGGPGRRLFAGLLQLGQALLLQMAGLLSALMIVELVFARPGVGRLLIDSLFQRDLIVMSDVLVLMALVILLARLVAEMLGGLRRFVAAGDPSRLPAAEAHAGRRLWPLFAALLLVVPLSLVILGVLTPPEAALQQDLQQRLAEPSMQHPLGTDALGRDIWARLRLGGLSTLARASLLAGAVLLPALLLGLMSAALWRRGGALWESLADLLLLPVDALLFLPLIPGAVALAAIAGPGTILPAAGLALLLLPRATHAARDLWRHRAPGSAPRHFFAVLAAIFLLTLFHGFVALLAMEYIGLGPQPPAASAGILLQETQQHLRVAPVASAALAAILALLSVTLFTPAAAVSDFVNSRRALVRFNE